MKRFFISLCCLAGLLSLQSANADEVDPLWAKVVVQHSAMKKWVAKNVEQQITATKDDEAPKLFTIQKEYKAWEKEKPVYTVLSITPPPKDASKGKQSFDMMELFTPMEEKIYTNKAAVKRNASQVVNGQACATFDYAESGMKLTLWVDEKSGALVKRVVEMAMPFTFEGSITTTYQAAQGGLQFPSMNEIKMSILIPFKKGKMELRDTYSNWFERL